MVPHRMALGALLCVLAVLGCSGHGRSPLTPSPSTNPALTGIGGAYELPPVVVEGPNDFVMPMARVQLVVHPDLTGELIFPRQAEAFGQNLLTDVTALFPAEFPSNLVSLTGITVSPEGHLVAELQVTHPFPEPNLSLPASNSNRADLHASHMRAILLLDGSDAYDFGNGPVSVNSGKLVNADGYTDSFPAPPGSGLTATAFPYVVFGTDNPDQLTAGNFHTTASGGQGWNHIPSGASTSFLAEPVGFNVFRQGGQVHGRMEFSLLPSTSTTLDFLLVVNYSPAARNNTNKLQAEYFMPAGAPQEAWRIAVAQTGGGLEDGVTPGDARFDVTANYEIAIYDWQHGHGGDVVADYPRASFRVGLGEASDISTVKLSIPSLLTGPMVLPVPVPDPDNAPPYGAPQLLNFTLDNSAQEAPEGTYWGMVEVVDSRIPPATLDPPVLTDPSSTYGINASTLELRALTTFRTYQIFPIVVSEGNLAPTARAVATTATLVPQGGSVTFDATASSDPNGDPLTFEWDFDGDGIFNETVQDGFTGAASNPTHAFLASGSVQVGMRVSDGRGGVDSLDPGGPSPVGKITVTVSLFNIPPVACFNRSDPTAMSVARVGIGFDATCSFDITPFSVSWDFNGDLIFGDLPTTGSPNDLVLTYAFPLAGTYQVRVRVTEIVGPNFYSTTSQPMTVRVVDPLPAFANPSGTQTHYYGLGFASGDFDNDTFADLAISAPSFHNVPTVEQPGRVFIYYGNGIGLDGSPRESLSPPATGGYNDKGAYGRDMVAADVNADGFLDIVVAHQGYSGAQALAGLVEVYINQAGAPGAVHFANGASTPTSTKRPLLVWTIPNPTPQSGSEGFGWSIDAVNINNDAFTDVLIGAYAAQRPSGQWQAGEAYAYRSTGAGMALSATLTKFPYYTADYMGNAIVGGDFDGDGDFDCAVGSPGSAVSGKSGAGYLCLWENRLGEVGFPAATPYGSGSVNQTQLVAFTSQQSDQNYARELLSADLNGDGAWELLVGIPGRTHGNNPNKSGAVAIYPGQAGFLTTFPTPTQILTSTAPADRALFSTSFALADFDNDTALDLIVGSPFADPGGFPDSGLAEIFLWTGASFNLESVRLTASPPVEGAEFGYKVYGAEIEGGAAAEALVGSPRSPITTQIGTVYPFLTPTD